MPGIDDKIINFSFIFIVRQLSEMEDCGNRDKTVLRHALFLPSTIFWFGLRRYQVIWFGTLPKVGNIDEWYKKGVQKVAHFSAPL